MQQVVYQTLICPFHLDIAVYGDVFRFSFAATRLFLFAFIFWRQCWDSKIAVLDILPVFEDYIESSMEHLIQASAFFSRAFTVALKCVLFGCHDQLLIRNAILEVLSIA